MLPLEALMACSRGCMLNMLMEGADLPGSRRYVRVDIAQQRVVLMCTKMVARAVVDLLLGTYQDMDPQIVTGNLEFVRKLIGFPDMDTEL